jgi:hypothetical protein
MNTELSQTENFVREYIAAWSITDDDERSRLVHALYAQDAEFFADEPGDGPVERRGVKEIVDNITQVNVRLVQGKGLNTEATGFAVNHDVVRVSWKMSIPEGTVVMTGMNLLTRDSDGLIVKDYIFIG